MESVRKETLVTDERLYRLSGAGDPNCTHCSQPETLEHLLLQCVQYSDERRILVGSYRGQGLASNSVDEFLSPKAHGTIVKRALSALLEFLESCALSERL
ncbi:hypothetical protein HPB52_004214 [Rhipicephalus sanguineus]|uniref:Tick transposon n=1 Tax=Rhipicephalus sanguineus TaxID=34632 RepID=A0A9D4Q5C4_RHISA|nr:hypothetical protein HPB52_004214 [Rhipicephalus sanguineus]